MSPTTTQQETPTHTNRTAKIIEIVCSSTTSFEDAITNGIADASQTINNISGADVKNLSVNCKDGKITEYRADLRIAFGVERKR